MTENGNGTNGHGWASWLKLGSVGVGVGAVLFGIISGFLKIDSRLEDHGKALQGLAAAVQKITERAASLDVVDARIERACLQMALANPGRFACPFGPAPAVVKRAAPPKASTSALSKQ